MHRIGIGITTNGRAHLLKALMDSIHRHTKMEGVKVYVADDSKDRVGVAKKKNECLWHLRDCEHVFLLDDDVEVKKDSWPDFFIESGREHLLFLKDTHRPIGRKGACDFYQDCGGVFMYMTKKCIDTVGAFNEKFGIYGFEHAEYSQRVCMAGLTESPYPCMRRTGEYIMAHDYSTQNHMSSITYEEKMTYIKINYPKFFNEPIKDIYIPITCTSPKSIIPK